METNLNINGLAGLTYDPSRPMPWSPTPSVPGLYPSPIPSTGGSTALPKKKGNGLDTASKILEMIVKTGMTVAQVKQMWDGKQPVIIQNPTTGASVDMRKELEEEAQRQGKSNEQMMAMLMAMMQQRENKTKEKDNTLLYVGVGVGVLALGGLAYFLATKRK